MPLAGDRLEGIFGVQLPGALFCLLGCAGVNTVRDFFLRCLTFPARLFQSNGGVGAGSKKFLLAAKPIFQSPIFRAIRPNFEKHPAAVPDPVDLAVRSTFPHLDIGQRHGEPLPIWISGEWGYRHFRYPLVPPVVPPGTTGITRKSIDQHGQRKTREALAVTGFGTSSDVRGRGVGGAGGNRTRVQRQSTPSSTCVVLSFDLTVATRTNTLRYGDSLNFRLWRRDADKA